MAVVFSTVHGSHLYGLANADSDHDLFVVTDGSHRPCHIFNMETREDRVEVGIHHFVNYALSGSHQSVEALFSQEKEWGEAWNWRPYLNGLGIGGPVVYDKYERTIRAFSFGDFKRRRHAVRLSMNLEALRAKHRFNPRLTSDQVATATKLALNHEGTDLLDKLGVPHD